MRKLPYGWRGWQVDGIRLLRRKFERRVDEQLGKTKLTVRRQNGKASQLDIGLYRMLAFGDECRRGVCIGMLVLCVCVLHILVGAVGRGYQPKCADGKTCSRGRGSARIICRRVGRVGSDCHVLGRRAGRSTDGCVDYPVPTARVIFVKFGLEGNALLAEDLLAHRHGIVEDEWNVVSGLPVVRLCVVIVVEVVFRRGQRRHELCAATGVAEGKAGTCEAAGPLRRAAGEGSVHGGVDEVRSGR
jgi:hypothetical protein